jgi:O-methyltransferase
MDNGSGTMSRLSLIRKFLFQPKPGILDRIALVGKINRNIHAIPAASTGLEHLYLADAVLGIPANIPGNVIEMGCYRGSSTATLSLACKLAGRKLIVCDSFEGLPEPKVGEAATRSPWNERPGSYAKGEYAGSLEDVKEAVRKHGTLEVCTFIKGYFCDTLPTLDEMFVMAFEDADLVSSVEDTLRYVWPRLQPGCKFFCHEAHDMKVASLFFRPQPWWDQPPGLIGAGTGLPLTENGCSMAYALKQM